MDLCTAQSLSTARLPNNFFGGVVGFLPVVTMGARGIGLAYWDQSPLEIASLRRQSTQLQNCRLSSIITRRLRRLLHAMSGFFTFRASGRTTDLIIVR